MAFPRETSVMFSGRSKLRRDAPYIMKGEETRLAKLLESFEVHPSHLTFVA